MGCTTFPPQAWLKQNRAGTSYCLLPWKHFTAVHFGTVHDQLLPPLPTLSARGMQQAWLKQTPGWDILLYATAVEALDILVLRDISPQRVSRIPYRPPCIACIAPLRHRSARSAGHARTSKGSWRRRSTVLW